MLSVKAALKTVSVPNLFQICSIFFLHILVRLWGEFSIVSFIALLLVARCSLGDLRQGEEGISLHLSS